MVLSQKHSSSTCHPAVATTRRPPRNHSGHPKALEKRRFVGNVVDGHGEQWNKISINASKRLFLVDSQFPDTWLMFQVVVRDHLLGVYHLIVSNSQSDHESFYVVLIPNCGRTDRVEKDIWDHATYCYFNPANSANMSHYLVCCLHRHLRFGRSWIFIPTEFGVPLNLVSTLKLQLQYLNYVLQQIFQPRILLQKLW